LKRRQVLLNGAMVAAASAIVQTWKPQSAAAAPVTPGAAPRITPITLAVNGLQFAALSCGPTEGPLVLCLHGFPQFKEIWTPVLCALGAYGFRAVAVDQRGYSVGAQPKNVSDYSNANIVSDILGFAASLGAQQFHLVGHDFGAFAGWQVAAQFPEQVLTYTSLSTPHRDAYSAALASDGAQQQMAAYVQLYQQPTPTPENFLLANNAAVLRASYQGVEPGTNTPPPGGIVNVVPAAEVNSNVAQFSQGATLADALNWYRAADLNAIGPVTVPTLYVWGSNDQALGRTAAVNTANFCTGIYQFVQLTGRSHWLLEEVPSDVVALVLQQVNSTLT
jgi:pimeloyl-ACP methyl ester carboxylesterase